MGDCRIAGISETPSDPVGRKGFCLRGERIDGRRRAREVGRARNARPYGTGTKKEGSFAFRFDIRLFIALRHDAAKLEHQPLGRGRAAVGDCGDALAE